MNFRQILKASLLLLIPFLLFGCSSTKQTIVPNLKIVDIPPLETEQSAELGDSILTKGKVYTYQGMDLKNQIQAGDGVLLLKFTIPPQKLVAKLEDKYWTYYVGENVTSYDAIAGTKTVFGGLKISKSPDASSSPDARQSFQNNYAKSADSVATAKQIQKGRQYAIFGNSTSVSMKPKPEPIFDFVVVNAQDKPSFTQELIYNGRSGDSVKFLYRELSYSYLRAPFNQEVQYDLKEGKVIGFKGVRIEIIEATNTQLKYKVIASFPDSL